MPRSRWVVFPLDVFDRSHDSIVLALGGEVVRSSLTLPVLCVCLLTLFGWIVLPAAAPPAGGWRCIESRDYGGRMQRLKMENNFYEGFLQITAPRNTFKVESGKRYKITMEELP